MVSISRHDVSGFRNLLSVIARASSLQLIIAVFDSPVHQLAESQKSSSFPFSSFPFSGFENACAR